MVAANIEPIKVDETVKTICRLEGRIRARRGIMELLTQVKIETANWRGAIAAELKRHDPVENLALRSEEETIRVLEADIQDYINELSWGASEELRQQLALEDDAQTPQPEPQPQTCTICRCRELAGGAMLSCQTHQNHRRRHASMRAPARTGKTFGQVGRESLL